MARCTSLITKHVWRVCDLRMPRALAFTPTTVDPTRDLSTTLATLNSISIVDLDICGQCDRQKRLITTSGPRKSLWILGDSPATEYKCYGRTEMVFSLRWKTEKCSRRLMFDKSVRPPTIPTPTHLWKEPGGQCLRGWQRHFSDLVPRQDSGERRKIIVCLRSTASQLWKTPTNPEVSAPEKISSKGIGCLQIWKF